MDKSSGSRASRKAPAPPKKPYPDFPLTPHPRGQWVKKIRGKLYYFGKWARLVDGRLERTEGDGWKEALEEYKRVADDLHAGRTPREKSDGLTVAGLCNHFLTAKLRKVEANELTPRLFSEYKEVAALCVSCFGGTRLVEDLAADDFGLLRATMAKKWGPVRLGNSITRIKSIFKYGYEAGLMDRPVRYGPEFVKPDKAVLRKHRAKTPAKMFEAEELRALIDGAHVAQDGVTSLVRPDTTLRAMILLGVNCAFGNTDCAELRFPELDLAGAWINFPRPKTGIARRCPLWPETVTAIHASLQVRAEAARDTDKDRVFLTVRGSPFVSHTEITRTDTGTAGGARKDVIGIQFRKFLVALSYARKGRSFYSLRHVFETIGGGSKDQVAVDTIMGHADPSMAAAYREHVDDARLKAVSDHVRKWLFGVQESGGGSGG